MRKSYILIHSATLGSREKLKRCLNKIPEVITWRSDMNHSFYIISEATAHEIAPKIRLALGSGRFLLQEITDNCHGWLTPDSWYLVNHKKLKKK